MNRHLDAAAPAAALAAADHTLGNTDADLSLLEYGDYECPACQQAEAPVRHLVEVFGKRMLFVFRHFPWLELHPQAELAAEAAEAAAAQGQFWAMHHLLFKHPHHLTLTALTRHAQAVGLDMNRFNAEMADRIYTQRVQEHRRAGERNGVRTTPSFFVNGELVDVSFGFEKLEEALHAALRTAEHGAAHSTATHAAVKQP